MPIYSVVLQDETGATKEVDYVVGWDSEKVEPDQVATACAIEHRIASGHCTRNGEPSFKNIWQPISCVPVVVENALSE